MRQSCNDVFATVCGGGVHSLENKIVACEEHTYCITEHSIIVDTVKVE